MTETENPATAQWSSFDEFYERHRLELYRAVAFAVGDPDLASEAVDEAFTRAAGDWSKVGGYQVPAGWVYRVAVNWARSVLRRNRYRHRLPIADSSVDDLPDVDVLHEVARLPHRQRVVVVARYYLDWSLADIAAALDVPTGTVKSRLNRALAVLERRLS